MDSGPLSHSTSSRRSRSDQERQLQAERDLARAQEDYQRLRSAYLKVAKAGHNEVELGMIGADMDRAHSLLQSLAGLRQLPFTHEPTRVVLREAQRLAEESS